jgi:hypothetical protein
MGLEKILVVLNGEGKKHCICTIYQRAALAFEHRAMVVVVGRRATAHGHVEASPVGLGSADPLIGTTFHE